MATALDPASHLPDEALRAKIVHRSALSLSHRLPRKIWSGSVTTRATSQKWSIAQRVVDRCRSGKTGEGR